ncbi:MAG: hypothetical protein WBO70_06940 [Erysipelotrichaceae bacterium]
MKIIFTILLVILQIYIALVYLFGISLFGEPWDMYLTFLTLGLNIIVLVAPYFNKKRLANK